MNLRLSLTSKRSNPKRMAAFATGGALLLAACGGSAAAPASEDTAAPVAEASDESAASDFPQFVAPTVGGGQLEFGSLEGQDTVLWFWAPW